MSLPQAIVAITTPMNKPVNVGTPMTVGAVVIANESPYAIQAFAGGSGKWISPTTADLLYCDGGAFDGSITLITTDILDNAQFAPSFVALLTTYAPGERIPGTYPVALNRLTNGTLVGNAANSLEQDMWTPFILGDTITPSHTGNVYQTTTGVAFLRQSDNSLLRISANATSQTLNTPSTTYYHDLNPDGSFSLGTTHSTQPNYLTIATIVTNASGNIQTLTDTRVRSSTLWNAMTNAAGAPGVSLYNLHVFKDIQADDQISVQGSFRTSSPVDGRAHLIGPGSAGNYLQVTPQYNDALTSIAFWVNPSGTPPLTAVSALWLGDAAGVNGSQIDSGGVIHAPAPVQLIGGHQETGAVGFGFTATAASQIGLYLQNFKTVMTNTPTSITLSVGFSQNFTGVMADFISKYGFRFFFSSVSTGLSEWIGTYTTAGNCLLAVDGTASTFDQHCDACAAVHRAQPFAALAANTAASPAGGADSLCYSCPSCGAIEAFNTALSAADEADMTPQGSGEYATTRGAQAKLIRQLMTALGLEVAP